MPSTLVLNADLDVCPALGTWIINNTQLLSGFSLLIAEDVLQELTSRHPLKDLSITETRAIRQGGDIAMAATILNGEISGLIHFPSPPERQARDVLSEPLVRAALLQDLPIALNPATASALMQGVKRSRRGYLIFNPVSGQGDPESELAEIRAHLEPQFMLQVWMTRPDKDPSEQAKDLIKEINAFNAEGEGDSIIIASGGDGTVGAVASALQNSNIPLGIIPRGTANAFSVALGIPTGLKAACTNLLLGNLRRVDVALCNNRPMILLAGLGFEAGMVDKASRELKNILGPMAYIFSGARQLVDQQPFHATMEIDGKEYRLDASAITMANAAPATSLMAQGFGEVIPDDGLLEVIVASPKDRISGLSVLSSLAWSAIMSSSANHNNNIACFRTKELQIELDDVQKLVIDGEVLDAKTITLSVNPGALQVVAPNPPEILNFASDPSIQRKISKMAARVCWNHPELSRQGIDQTRLVIDQGNDTVGIDDAFHFLVLGDSGTGRHRLHSPPRRIAERLLPHKSAAAFLLHTGDVVYLVGAMDQYRANFLRPYREWLHYGKDWKTISPEGLMFNQPFLPVLGNHDYYDLSLPVALIAGLTLPFRRHLQWFDDIDAGWRGSRQGEAYACVFLDVLNRIPPVKLSDHLKLHYNAVWDGHRCLRYRPGVNTRLPNRYYRFQHAGVDVFALDSNTLITPDQATNNQRNLRRDLRTLEERQSVVYRRLASSSLDENHRDDLFDELETLQEECFDLQRQIKQINQLKQSEWVDHEQLEWLKEGLIRSHRDRSVRGRILTMHHPAYVTEKTKCGQADTKAIRRQMRDVFDAVVLALGEDLGQARPVDLVLSGHAHCLEVIRSHDTGHADSHINWVICGGSGYGLRAQRREGAELTEQTVDGNSKVVATSELFIGRNWPAAGGRDSYSGLRVDIAEGRPLSIRLTPLVSCRDSNGWLDADPESIRLRM